MKRGDLEDGRSRRYIFLWVRILDNPIWVTLPAHVFKVAIGLLLSANFRPSRWYDGHEEHMIPRGSFVTSINRCAEFCRLSVQQIRTSWEHLENIEFSTFTPTHYGTIVSITNYDEYQPGEVVVSTTANNSSTRRQHDVNTHKVKESEEVKSVDNFSLSPNGEPVSHPGVPADHQTVGSALPGNPGLNSPVDGKPWFPEGMALNVGDRAKKLAEVREFDIWFDRDFWPKYPRKVGKAEAKRAAWKKLKTPEQRSQSLRRLEFELNEMLAREPKYRPHASTWFNQDHWNDPIEEDPAPLFNGQQSAWDKLT